MRRLFPLTLGLASALIFTPAFGGFTHTDSQGNVVGSETWTATDLGSFEFYGCGVIGGRWQGNVATVESYDPRTNRWQHLPDMPSARSGLTSGVIGDDIHVTGGEDPNSNRAYPEHEVFNIGTGTWSRFPDLPLPRHGVGSAVVDGRWYVTGGSQFPGAGESDTVYVFTP